MAGPTPLPAVPVPSPAHRSSVVYGSCKCPVRAGRRRAGLRPGSAILTVHGLNPAILMTSTQTLTLTFLALGEA